MIVLFVGPACSGKTMGIRFLKSILPLKDLPSASTRAPREDDDTYIFLTKEEFEAGIEEGLFIEHDEYDGHYYGTMKKSVEEALANPNVTYIKAITVEGARKMKELYGEQVMTVFIKPKDPEEWIKRLTAEGRDSQYRVKSYYEEIAVSSEFDQEIVNGDLSTFFFDLSSLMQEKLQYA